MRIRLKSYLKATQVVDVLPIRTIVTSRISLREEIGNIDSLADSIRRKGLLEPIIVRPLDSKFEIVAGHRRYSACRMCGFSEIPAIVIPFSDKEAFEVALEENLQRRTLDPIEEARAFKIYVEKYGHGSVTELARSIGKSQEYVSHRLMLLKLPWPVQEQVRRRLLSASDAWELSRIRETASAQKLASTAIERKLTVRQLRQTANFLNSGLDLQEAIAATDPDIRTPSESINSQKEESRRIKIGKAGSSILRIAMIRIDDLLSNLGSNDTQLKEELLRLRVSLHKLIDEHVEKQILNNWIRPDEEIATMIKSKFLQSFNNQDIPSVLNLRSNNFTLFDDFPPLGLMNFRQSEKHDSSIFKTMTEASCEIKDLKVTTFGAFGALATFIFHYDVRVAGYHYLRNSRVTFVFEKTNSGWRIIHEHWSQADPKKSSSEEFNETRAFIRQASSSWL